MKILFTFPGQGGQRPGMLAALPDREAILTQARAVLGDEVDTLDSADALQHTRAVQLCLLIAGVAWARELQRQGVDPQMVSGLSIGAFPAAVIAGALDFASALRLVALRGDLMEQAYPEGYGLTAIMGLTRPRVEALMQGHEVYLANLNAETQFVIAGRDEAMAEVAQLALRATQLHPHNDARNGFQGQRIEGTDAQPPLTDACNLARRLEPAVHQTYHILAVFKQRPRRLQRQQVAPFVDKQRAAHPLFQGMQRAVNADAAEFHRFGGSGDITFRHKHHKDRQLAEGDLLVNILLHGPSTLLV